MEQVALKRSQTQEWLYQVIFEDDTSAGKSFDIGLILCIVLSVLVVMLDSVESIRNQYGTYLFGIEWFFTLLFTAEYLLRLYCAKSAWRYASSFFGGIDLLAILPTYIDLLLPGSHFLLVVRVLRVLRVFRVLKLVKFVSEATHLQRALYASRRKITVFLFSVSTMVIILGSIMYLVEGKENGFTSIPTSIYWTIVTITTVGYGDISPKTFLGKTIASVTMIVGFAILAVPTGIVTYEMAVTAEKQMHNRTCPACRANDLNEHDRYCKHCGTQLEPTRTAL